MVNFPNAKINLGLSVTSKRADGYHNIESIFYPISCRDVLEIGEFEKKDTSFFFYGEKIEGEIKSNLIYKATEVLKSWCVQNEKTDLISKINALQFHLYKKIPSGAGLGGGSADGTFTLKMINEILSLGIQENVMENLAAKLGSDCVFFVKNKPAIVKGRGEIIEPINLSLKEKFLALIHPGIHVSTAEAYEGISPEKSSIDYHKISQLNISEWKNILKNDFEKTVFEKYPLIKEIKNSCYEKGAAYAQMSGSGSAIYALCETEEIAKKIKSEITGKDFKNFCFQLD